MQERGALSCAHMRWVPVTSTGMTGVWCRGPAALRTTHLPYRASSFIAASNPLSVVGNILSSPIIPRIIPVLWL